MGYIANFIVYTLAMVGVIVVALLVFKNATSVGCSKSSKYLKIIDSISLGQRKNLFIVSTGNEQFLIAGDVNNTNLISKLENLNDFSVIKRDKSIIQNEQKHQKDELFGENKSFQETMTSLSTKNYMDRSNIGIKSSLLSENSNNNSVMRNLAEFMKK